MPDIANFAVLFESMAPFSRPVAAPRLRLVASSPEAHEPRRPHLDDSELLGAVRGGDPSAAASLHDRVRPQVDRTIRRLLGTRDSDHEDLAQLAMIELVYSLDRFRGDCSLDSWTSMITARVVYKEIRQRRAERRIFSGCDVETLEMAEAPSLSRRATARSLLGRVLKVLDSIDPAKAWTYLLHDVLGYDLKEIATITDSSVAAAQTRLVRGRRELHEQLAADPELVRMFEGGFP